MHFANFRSLNNGNYNVSWMYDTATDRLHFMTEVMTTGWIGFGFATRAPTGMIGYDVAVGGVVDGTGYLRVMLFCFICIQPVPVSQRVGKVKRSGGRLAGSRKEKNWKKVINCGLHVLHKYRLVTVIICFPSIAVYPNWSIVKRFCLM